MSWEAIAKESQAQLLQSIPARWRLREPNKYRSMTDLTSVPHVCCLLTEAQLKITDFTAVQLVRRLESRELSAVQVLEAFAARTAVAHQLVGKCPELDLSDLLSTPQVNCLTDWFFEDGMRQARELDERLDKGKKLKGPLHGVPMALKDSHLLKGRATTSGYVSKRNLIAEYDSDVVGALRAAGAVFYCKTTMPQTGMALETVSNLWGRTLNPYNTALSAGGSSGGDAALVAMKGCPMTPSSDMGGSIRVPAAFNGLYAMRPTAALVPDGGINSTGTVHASISLSCGPICRSMEDVDLLAKVILGQPREKSEVADTPVQCRDPKPRKGKLLVGMMKWDGVVMPHPPVLDAIEHTRRAVESAGHEVVEFEAPFDCWDASRTTFDIYYPSGSGPTMDTLKASGEPPISVFRELLETYNPREMSTAEKWQLNIKTALFRAKFEAAWAETARQTCNHHPMDALICPPAPATGSPHDFNVYWGYTSLFNLLDHPSVILPVPKMKINEQQVIPDVNYQPLRSNPYDQPNYEMYANWFNAADKPVLSTNQPRAIQIVSRPFEDEKLVQIAYHIDTLLCGR